MLKQIAQMLGVVVAVVVISTMGPRSHSWRQPTSVTSIGDSRYWSVRMPREMRSVREAYEHLDEVFETQLSLFLSHQSQSAGAEWEVRYDAWRDGKPLRYLVVRVDAQTGQVTRVSG